MQLDPIDRRILGALQIDATQTLLELAETAGVSKNACWRRVRRLEDEQFIVRRVAILNRARLGVPGTVFISVRTNDHSEAWTARFAEAVRRMPEVVEIYRLSGDVDYLLKAVISDISAYDRIYKILIRSGGLFDVSSSFAMECLKETTAVPLVSANI